MVDDSLLREAQHLLADDNLVWSADMEAIRAPLAALVQRLRQSEHHHLEAELVTLAMSLTATRPSDL